MSSGDAQPAAERQVALIEPVNLLEERRVIRREVLARSRRLLIATLAVIVLSSAAIVPMQIAASGKRQAAARLGNELIAATAAREKAQDLAVLVAAKEELLKKLSEESAKTRLWRNLLAELSSRTGDEVWLTSLSGTLSQDEATVKIGGGAENLRGATGFASGLKAARFFDRARLASTQTTGGLEGRNVTHFECEATLSQGAVAAAGRDTPLVFGAADDGRGNRD